MYWSTSPSFALFAHVLPTPCVLNTLTNGICQPLESATSAMAAEDNKRPLKYIAHVSNFHSSMSGERGLEFACSQGGQGGTRSEGVAVGEAHAGGGLHFICPRQ